MDSRRGLVFWLGVVALPALVMLVYWAGLGGPFIFDDFPALVDNPKVHAASLTFEALRRAAFGFDPGGSGRPLAMLTFALNYALGGLEPWGWKLGGLLVHLCNVLLVYGLCLQVLRLAGVDAHRRLSAWVLALTWAVHPLQVSAVLYVVQRMETLSLTFVLLALLCYLRGRLQQVNGTGARSWFWIGATAPLIGVSLASKETALLFPAYALALELTFLRFEAAGPATRKFWRWGYGLGCLLAALVFALLVVPHYATKEQYAIRDFDAFHRVLTQLRVLPLYLQQMLLPLPGSMTFYYDDMVASRSLFDPVTTFLGGGLLCLLFAAAVYVRRRMPLFALGVFWFFGAHFITSNVVPLELVFEHRNYFALLGVLLSVADLVRRIPVRDGPAIKMVGIGAVVVAVGFLGTVRAATWGDRLLLATDLASVNPHSPRAAHELGVLYYEMADGSADSPFYSLAKREFERESRLPAASILAEQALILMEASHGEPVDPALWERMYRRLREQPITPQTSVALFGMAENREKGVVFDDRMLDKAFLLMFDRVEMPPYSYAQVADHVLRFSHDEALARSLLLTAVDRSVETPGYVSVIVKGLRADGRVELAKLVIDRARQRGIAVEAQ